MIHGSASRGDRPIIGITTYGRNERAEFHLYASYVEAVRRAGGVPILLPPGEPHLDAVLDIVQGLVLTGGGDIHPDQYQGNGHPTIYNLDDERDQFELQLATLALQTDLALLGICRGLQILSVASGGTLLPHLPDAVGLTVLHREEPRQPIRHPVQIVQGSLLWQLTQVEQMEVVSWHHQAVPTVPPGWQAAAYAPDGVIEALEHQHHPWAIAVQWHPELSATLDPLQQRLFDALIQASRPKQSGG